MSETASVVRSPLLRVVGTPERASPLVEALLREQQTLTAVERFSRAHDSDVPAQARYYRDLIPLTKPAAGQQYAFQVDLDACTGCKACVVACHSLNGLEETEIWRSVGLLHGGTEEAPAQQTVTTSCHHCVDPACMSGCPVKAYEKDPVTGIVRHLDDQCIGCQYCTLMCPYDAPKYDKGKGIVRKCDMCSTRLAVSEAPACVQGCPNSAIAIRIVDQAEAVQASEAGTFLPGAPAPQHTMPTTVYTSARAIPKNMLPADFYTASPEQTHTPLAVMLVLTQLAVGGFIGDLLLQRLFPGGGNLVHAVFAMALAVVALAAATLHLGRPLYAFRAVLGFRTSWMSREIIALGLFAKAGVAYSVAAGAHLLPEFPGKVLLAASAPALQIVAAVAGGAGVLCSVMLYAATRRPHWRGDVVGLKFLGTTLILGAAALRALDATLATLGLAQLPTVTLLAVPVAAVALAKMLYEAAVLRHLSDRQHSTWKRVAIVMTRDLKGATFWRFAVGLSGAGLALVPAVGWRGALVAVMSLVLLGAGEFLERYLFFRAAPASRMPGAVP